MKRAEIYYKDNLAGILTETDCGYEFCYSKDYLGNDNAEPVSLTLPLTDKPYHSNVLFPFFDGLIPEAREALKRFTVAVSESEDEI